MVAWVVKVLHIFAQILGLFIGVELLYVKPRRLF
jgi:hypothetical protein